MDTELYTWATLGTFAGASAATLLVVQYLKVPLDKLAHIPTRLLVLLVAFLILVAAHTFGGGFAWQDLPLMLVNAFLVALTAMGAYENTFAHRDTRKKEPPDEPDAPN